MRYHDITTEARMTPTAFGNAITTGDAAGVLVGFEFEVCIPKRSIEFASGKTAQYTDDIESWISGKSMSDLTDGIKSKGYNVFDTLTDILKIKNSVARQDNISIDIQYTYKSWAHEQIRKSPEYSIAGYLKFVKDTLNSSDFQEELIVPTGEDANVSEFARKYKAIRTLDTGKKSNKWTGKDFTNHVLKLATGMDFTGDIQPESITPQVEKQINDAIMECFYGLNRPFDYRMKRLKVDSFYQLTEEKYMEMWTKTGSDYNTFKPKFIEFCTTVLGSDDLKTLLKTKLAFYGRTNNTTGVLKQKLWYFITPDAQVPDVLSRGTVSNSDKYKRGAEFVKENMKSLLGDNSVIFNRYHERTKDMTTWYIEPDGSLRPDDDDSAVEIVSPPLAANEAMKALNKFYSEAEKLKLYTGADNRTGLHINVSIPQTLDVVKLALFMGDIHVLKKFDRLDNPYSDSIIRQLSAKVKNDSVSLDSFPDAQETIQELVDEISGEHTTSINYNGKYISFRHAGGNYLSLYKDIYQTVGRFIHAMIIASTPTMYKREYMTKLGQMLARNQPNGNTPQQIIRSNRIPVVYTDIVLRLSPENQNKEGVNAALNHAQNWIKNSSIGRYGGETMYKPVIKQDPSARQRILNAKGFASDSLESFKQLPDYAFYRVTFYPIDAYGYSRAKDKVENPDQQNGSKGFTIWGDGADKVAGGVQSAGYIGRSDPMFIKSYNALVSSGDRNTDRLPLPE